MTTDAFQKNLAQLAVSAKQCLEKDQYMSALVLIYSLIDTFAWAVASRTETNTRTRFEHWLEKFVYPTAPLPCTPGELYAARCGILHTLTPEADLHKRSKLRQIAYAWGNAKIETFDSTSQLIGADKFVGIHIEHLLSAICSGVDNTSIAAGNDAKLKRNLDDAAARHFLHVPPKTLERIASAAKNASY